MVAAFGLFTVGVFWQLIGYLANCRRFHRNSSASRDVIDQHRECRAPGDLSEVRHQAALRWANVIRSDDEERVDLRFLGKLAELNCLFE